MEQNKKNWAWILFMGLGFFCCWKIIAGCRGKCRCHGKNKRNERKSVIKMKNCNGCWVISFK